ncbi:MAG: hypothetical protein GQF41_2014 [Candidatus Rifleibacterium amylolyticum]|nr:MAG: hypothetical protein GQF41_2014 [Candidatus Rifleibacterium amylolyticum]
MKIYELAMKVVLAVSLAIFAITGCQPPAKNDLARKMINIWLDANPRELEFFREIGGRIEKEMPGVTLNWKVARLNDLKPEFLGNAERAASPDIILLVNDWIGELSRQKLLLPITASLTHILPTMLDGVKVEGQVHAVPWSFESLAFFYNTDLVATPPRSFNELVTLGGVLATGSLHPFMYENKNFYYHAALFFGFGADIFAADGHINLQSAAHEESLNFARDLHTRWKLLPAKANYPAMINLFGRSKVPMIITGPWSLPEIERSPVNFAVTAIPDIDDGRPARPFIGIKAFAINSHTSHRDEALKVVEMLCSKQVQTLAAQRIGLLPCCDIAPDQLTLYQRGFLAGARHGVPLPPGESMKFVWQETNWILNEIFTNQQRPISEILAEAQGRIEQLEGRR